MIFIYYRKIPSTTQVILGEMHCTIKCIKFGKKLRATLVAVKNEKLTEPIREPYQSPDYHA